MPELFNDHEKKDLYRLLVARSDFTAALAAVRYIIEHVGGMSHELWVPLQDAAIVSYARPFTANKPFGPLPKRYGTFEDNRLQGLHENVIELRHKTIAHSDADIRRILVVPRGVKIGPVESSIGGGVAVLTKRLPPEHFSEMEELILHVGRRVNEDIEKLSQRIRTDPAPPDYAYDLLTGEPEPDEVD